MKAIYFKRDTAAYVVVCSVVCEGPPVIRSTHFENF